MNLRGKELLLQGTLIALHLFSNLLIQEISAIISGIILIERLTFVLMVWQTEYFIPS